MTQKISYLVILVVLAIAPRASADVGLLVTLYVFMLVRWEQQGERSATETNHSPEVL